MVSATPKFIIVIGVVAVEVHAIRMRARVGIDCPVVAKIADIVERRAIEVARCRQED